MPSPTRRGWRTHQKVSTSATKSGTKRRSGHGRKVRKSAMPSDAAMVLTRAGRRMSSDLPSAIVVLVLVLGAARRLLGAPVLLRVLRARRAHRGVREHQHVAAAVHARGRLAYHAREGELRIALDAHHRG